MQALLTAIKSKFDTVLSTTHGVLYFDRVVEGTAKPYCRYSIITNELRQPYGKGFGLEDVRIQFDIWAVGANTVLTLQDDLQDTFDDVALTLSPSEGTEANISATRIRSRSLLDGVDDNGDEVYRAISEYTFTVQRVG